MPTPHVRPSARAVPLTLLLALSLATAAVAGCGGAPVAAPKDAAAVGGGGSTAVAGADAPAAAPAGDTPTAAFHALRDAVAARDWGAFYDGMGPTMRAAEAAKPAADGASTPAEPRARFIADMEASMALVGQASLDAIGPESFLAIWEGVEVVGEAVDGDRAVLTVRKAEAEWRELFVREDGRWKFDGVPEGNGP